MASGDIVLWTAPLLVIAMHSNAKADGEIAALGDLSRHELVVRWSRIYGCRPPSGVRRDLLRLAVAWDLQAKRFGGLSSQTRKALAATAARLYPNSGLRDVDCTASENIGQGSQTVGKVTNLLNKSATSNSVLRSRPQPGARLIREWNGKTNVVDVVDGAFLFEGREYASLSAVARQITGAHWSGPRFFGL